MAYIYLLHSNQITFAIQTLVLRYFSSQIMDENT